MGREKRTMAGPATAKERHRRKGNQIDRNAPLPEGLVARKAVGKVKHRTYLEIVENKDFKRKPLDFENTTQREPPELFTFVPLGNPELTTLCKDMSREKGALVFIVSTPSGLTTDMAYQVNRVGYHFRSAIVEEAMDHLDVEEMHQPLLGPNGVEIIPHSQQEINEQADAALRELFPKIPHTDRGEIISHAFRKGKQTNGEPVVGLQTELSLSRRVQLAVLAHIRHRHTRYDELLRETTWANARRVTEAVCLDYLVKWRGDDESGRDQLDEILREVVVLSDDDSDDEDESSSEADDSLSKETSLQPPGPAISGIPSAPVGPNNSLDLSGPMEIIPQRNQKAKTPKAKSKKAQKLEKKKNERGFKRYGATRRLAVWDEAVRRMRAASEAQSPEFYTPPPPNGSGSHPSSFREVNTPLNAGPDPYHIDLTSPQGMPVEGRTANGAFRTPPYIHARPSYAAHTEVSGAAHTASPLGHGNARPTVWQPAGAQTQLQDMLHPSIEPLSPGAAFGQNHRSIVHERPLETRRYHDDQIPREVIVIREHRDPAPPKAYHGHYTRESVARRVDPAPVVYEDRAPGLYMQDRQEPPSGWRPPMSSDHTWRSGHTLPSHMRTTHLSTDQSLPHSKSYPDMRPLEYGEPSRTGIGPNARVSEVHRPLEHPVQHVRYLDERHAPYSQGAFLTLREHAPSHDIPRDEGFIRLREAPVIHREPPPPQDVYRPEDPYLLIPNERQPAIGSGERRYHGTAAGPAYIHQDGRPLQDQGAYDHRAGPYSRPHEDRRFGYQEVVPTDVRGHSQYSHGRRQAPRTPLQHHQDVVIIDS